MSRNKSIVVRYNQHLYENPLLVKSVTGATLSSLGELISQCTAIVAKYPATDDNKQSKPLKLTQLRKLLCELKLSRVLMMACYGGLINAPINHFLYGWITKTTNMKVMTNKMRKLLQLLASLSIVAPLQVFFLVCTLTLVNGNINGDLKKMLSSVKHGLKSKYLKILTSSWVSTSVLVSTAQKFVEPEKWSIFFSFAYAILGTGQNIYLKLKDTSSMDKNN